MNKYDKIDLVLKIILTISVASLFYVFYFVVVPVIDKSLGY